MMPGGDDIYGVWRQGRLVFVGKPDAIRRRFSSLRDPDIDRKSKDGYPVFASSRWYVTKLLTRHGNRMPNRDRDLVAAELRDRGYDYEAIADVLGITVDMARGAVSRVRYGRYGGVDGKE